VSDQSLRDALEQKLATTDGWAVSNEFLLGLLAAHPAKPAPHEPIGVHPTDAGVFVRCACGENPTPKYWIEDHWQGDRAEGERLVRDLLAAHLPRNPVEPAPVITDEAVQAGAQALEAWAFSRPAVHLARKILEAAAPLLGPRPMPSWEQIEKVVADVAAATGLAAYFKSGTLTDPSDLDEFTNAFHALLNGAES
jgi:hypothetical protein